MRSRSLESLPGDEFDSLVARGLQAQRADDLRGATDAYRQVLATDPTEPRAIRHLGAILAEGGAAGAAVELFESGLQRVGPSSPAALGFYNNYANALRRAQRHADSERILRELVSMAPRVWQPWHNLGQTLRDQGRFEEAAAAMRHAVSLEPGFGPNHGVLGEALFRLGELEDAEAALTRCLQLGSVSDPQLWATLGEAQRLSGRLGDALATYERALAVTGPTPIGLANLGLVLAQLGHFERAIEHLDAAVDLAPGNARIQAHRGYVLLSAGRFPEAWDAWEEGFVVGVRGPARRVAAPRWIREDTETRVLVHREQGLGDEIIFASCYPDIIAAAREVVVECEPRLTSLFARSFPEAEVRPVSLDAAGNETMHDHHRVIPAGSLPQIFRRNLDEFPRRRVLLKADPGRVAVWSERLRALGPAPYVGVAWRSRLMSVERRREYTCLEEWGDLFAVPGVTWVNLQYDECESELRDAEQRFDVRVQRWESLDLMNDLDEVAALTTALDAVVAPRTAVAMLSAALGVDTIIVASRYSWPDLGTERLPWLPAAKLVYREPSGSWAPVLTAAAEQIAEVARRTHQG